MQSKNSFVAGLFVIALCAFVAGGISLYKNVDVWLHAQTATMELTDPDKKVVSYSDVLSTRTLDVTYVSDAGEVVVPQKVVPDKIAERLVAGERIPITYLTNNPKRVFYNKPRPPNPWVWLVVGFAALATAVYALRLHKRELAE